jgi:high-affinity nickel-transport protein
MPDSFVVIALGFVLGMRHATDADHVVAITTIVSRQTGLRPAILTGLLWGIGHSLTVTIVGAAIVLFNVTIPERVGIGMELAVGAMLVVLGLANMAPLLRFRAAGWRTLGGAPEHVHSHAHSHGDYVHTHPHGHSPETHPHRPDYTPLAALDRRLGGWKLYTRLRPVVIGVVHGLAGSAAVTLLILAAVREPGWAMVYLLVFGVGTITGMMLVTYGIATAVKLAAGRSESVPHHLGFATGLASVVFGVVFAWRVLGG